MCNANYVQTTMRASEKCEERTRLYGIVFQLQIHVSFYTKLNEYHTTIVTGERKKKIMRISSIHSIYLFIFHTLYWANGVGIFFCRRPHYVCALRLKLNPAENSSWHTVHCVDNTTNVIYFIKNFKCHITFRNRKMAFSLEISLFRTF